MLKSGSKPSLLVLGEHRVAIPIRPHAFKHESRTSLTAYICDSDEVLVHRLGGQLIHRLESDDLSGKPTCIEWAARGETLLIGTDTGIVDKLDLTSGRLNQGPSQRDDGSRSGVSGVCSHIAHLSALPNASSNATNGNATNGTPPTAWLDKLSISQQDSTKESHQLAAVLSLPHMLARVDVSEALPKLSSIPGPAKAGPGMPVAVLRLAQKDLHIALNNKGTHSPCSIDVTFTSYEDESVESSVGEIFHRSFDRATEGGHRFVTQCTSSLQGIHAVARKIMLDENSAAALSVDLFQIPFSISESVHTGTILSSAVQLQRLTLYISQCIDTAALDWNTLTGLPKRFLANINETLEEKAEGPIQNHLAQLLLTGSCSDTISEWLKEDLAERGHKRWELAMTSFHHTVKHLLEINLLPAIERCSMCASTLRGLATYYEGSKRFDVQPRYLTTIIECLDRLQLLAHAALQTLAVEETQFNGFSKWLKIRVDIASSEAGSPSHAELLESEAAGTDAALVLSYLTGPFMQSRLETMIGRKLSVPVMDGIIAGPSISLNDCAAAIRELKKTESYASDVLYLPLQLRCLQQAVEACLTQMKRWQGNSWLPSSSTQMAFDAPLDLLDIALQNSAHGPSLELVGTSMQQSHTICRQSMAVAFDAKSVSIRSGAQQKSTFRLPEGHAVLDLKLLKTGGIVALVQNDTISQSSLAMAIIHLPSGLTRSDGGTRPIGDEEMRQYIVHPFEAGDAFHPNHIYVSEGKRGASAVVLDKTRTAWKVLRLTSESDGSIQLPLQLETAPFGLPANDDEMLVD